eukprot:g6713.t1
MYDFCFTYPFAFLLGVGGLMGYISKGSTASLYGGVGSALLLFLLGYISLQYYHQGKLCKTATFFSLVVSIALTAVMYLRYSMTGKFFPAGITMLICGCMCVFYLWSLGFGPKPKVKGTN